jgi:hypothetical protein
MIEINLRDIKSISDLYHLESFTKERDFALIEFNTSIKYQASLKNIQKNYKKLIEKQSNLKLIEDLIVFETAINSIKE